jgi:hypothetical protein
MGETDEQKPPDQKQPKKFADHPHLWTITLSSIAIVVSGLSYFESHRTRVMNEQLNRPIVRATAIDVGSPVLGSTRPQGDKFQNSYTLHVRNSGKLFARAVLVSYKAQLQDIRAIAGGLRFSSDKDATIQTTQIGDLATDEDYEVIFWAFVMKDPPKVAFGDHQVSMITLYVKGEVAFTDPLTNSQVKQTFCFNDPGTQGHFRRCSMDESPR